MVVEFEVFLLGVEDGVVFFVLYGGYEGGFVFIGVEGKVVGVELFEVVFFEGFEEDVFGYFEIFVEVDEVLEVGRFFFGFEFFFGDYGEGMVEVVNVVDEVFGEFLDGEVMGGFYFMGSLVLEVVEVGNGVEVFVLVWLLVYVGDYS